MYKQGVLCMRQKLDRYKDTVGNDLGRKRERLFDIRTFRNTVLYAEIEKKF